MSAFLESVKVEAKKLSLLLLLFEYIDLSNFIDSLYRCSVFISLIIDCFSFSWSAYIFALTLAISLFSFYIFRIFSLSSDIFWRILNLCNSFYFSTLFALFNVSSILTWCSYYFNYLSTCLSVLFYLALSSISYILLS